MTTHLPHREELRQCLSIPLGGELVVSLRSEWQGICTPASRQIAGRRPDVDASDHRCTNNSSVVEGREEVLLRDQTGSENSA